GPLRARYELRGILHHLGRHAFAGHYVTDVREEGRKGWKRYDDSVVSPVTEAEALGGEAQRTCYLCFYSLVVDAE
ncbi:unnamed protein product, partial [Ectocarpus fasciculatus]